MHSLTSPFVASQLALRAERLNDVRLQPEGEFVLYWMQSTHRFEDNWALRFAVLEADRLNRPLLVHQGLDPTYEHANDRIHAFILENARELARRAASAGFAYQFALRRRRDDDRRVVDRLAARACLVVTDRFPTAGIAERTARFAARAPCRVVAVESHAIVPAAHFAKEEYAARTLRPKIMKLLDASLEPAEDRAARRALPDALWRSLDVDRLPIATLDDAAITREIARCEIDHAVPPVPREFVTSGRDAALARLRAFCDGALGDYERRRADPTDRAGSSRLSPYLHFGQISAAEVARAARDAGPAANVEKFLDELVTWRELALNFCLRNPRHRQLRALPDWVHRTMEAHKDDPREAHYSLAEFEEARTHDPLWNAAQRELRATGTIHNVVRMLWGKSVILWTKRYKHALEHLIVLNDKWALDGRDPSSYGGIQWCFGKFDRPWFDKPVWGVIRPMSIARAYDKWDAAGYIRQWEERAS
ncbi:MAG: deoxyribodipyrimidine photo-lyase [Gemmatimonadetes bacterium]|nr:deoxyribodipyrimidine photo-lyase [Gemmatimonadota bacterium]